MREDRTVWRVPQPLNHNASVETAATVAAPLLAGFCFTLFVLLLPELRPSGPAVSASFSRFPEAAITLLLIAGVALIGAVQGGLWTRRRSVTPDELRAWFPEAARDPDLAAFLRAFQRSQLAAAERWAEVTRWADNAGILLFLATLAVLVVPPAGGATWERWTLVVVAALGFAAEVAWVLTPVVRRRAVRRAPLDQLLEKVAPGG